MADPATLGLVLVEPPAFFDPDGDLLMTGQALSRQDIPIRRVTGRAILDSGLSDVGSAQGARGIGNTGFLRKCGGRSAGCRPNRQGGNQGNRKERQKGRSQPLFFFHLYGLYYTTPIKFIKKQVVVKPARFSYIWFGSLNSKM